MITRARFGSGDFLANKLEDLKNGKKVDINEKNTTHNKQTALIHAACLGGNLDITKALLDRGADKEAKDILGWTPLFSAAYRGYKEIVELLINAGAKLDAKDNDGDTPLYYATYRGHREIVELLIKAGADVHAKNKNGETPLNTKDMSAEELLASF